MIFVRWMLPFNLVHNIEHGFFFFVLFPRYFRLEPLPGYKYVFVSVYLLDITITFRKYLDPIC